MAMRRTAPLKLILTNKKELLGEAEVIGTQGESDHVISEFIIVLEGKAELQIPKLQILVKETSTNFTKHGL